VFWICPIIEESEKLQVKNVSDVFEHIQKQFAPIPVGMLHGRIKPKEKTQIIEDFARGKIKILVSTSVVEVGIDIPDANIIVIEGAERFGLAQLHQLRGRVGRRERPSWCFLFPSNTSASKSSSKRLDFFTKNNNGIELAEFDLNERGPGEIYGTIQSGIPNLKIASITDLELIKKTREAVELMQPG
jgi:ATP-dependent DNA helicase RecG